MPTRRGRWPLRASLRTPCARATLPGRVRAAGTGCPWRSRMTQVPTSPCWPFCDCEARAGRCLQMPASELGSSAPSAERRAEQTAPTGLTFENAQAAEITKRALKLLDCLIACNVLHSPSRRSKVSGAFFFWVCDEKLSKKCGTGRRCRATAGAKGRQSTHVLGRSGLALLLHGTCSRHGGRSSRREERRRLGPLPGAGGGPPTRCLFYICRRRRHRFVSWTIRRTLGSTPQYSLHLLA